MDLGALRAHHMLVWPDMRNPKMSRRHRGELIGAGYILDSVLGVGGMGIVYSAHQLSLAREVAVKMPRMDVIEHDAINRRFRCEAAVAGRVTHRNLVAVIDCGEADGRPFLVMERLHGELLGRLVRGAGALDPRLAVELVAQMLDALHAAHSCGVVHADVKPDNVLVEKDRASSISRLFDFGVARILGTPNESSEMVYGTPDYLAPELIRGGLPMPASDIYAAGIMLFELLTGAPPFAGGQSHDVLARHLQMEPMPPSRARDQAWIPAELDDVTLRALAKRSDHRFPDAATFADELRATLPALREGPPPHARPQETIEQCIAAYLSDGSRGT